MRNAFIEELVAAAEVRDNIVLVVGDLGYGVVEPFAKRFPKRFFNSGVAEQNMMGLSAGLASEGFHVFVYSIANFPTFRCAEQIRNDVDYHNLPVTIVAVGGGVAYGNLGYSHHAVQDYALMRVMPNMLIAAPGDPMEVRACMRYILMNPGPSYLRLGKAGEKNIHLDVPVIHPGKWLTVKPLENLSDTKTILTTGCALEIGMKMSKSKEFEAWGVCSLPLWGMQQKVEQPTQVEKFTYILTIEDHLYDAGFGSWLHESLAHAPSQMIKVKNLALNTKICGMVGKQEVLNACGGL